MNLLMAHRAVLESRRAQIVKRGRDNPDRACSVSRRQIRVAFQTNDAYFLARQHAGIGRAVGLMAGRTAFKTHRAVFEREGPALVAMTLQTARLVSAESLRHSRTNTAVRIVAIDAAHRTFRQLVMIRSLKLRPHVRVATRALFVDRCGLSIHQPVRSVGVNFVTGGAGDLIFGMTALQPANVGRLI